MRYNDDANLDTSEVTDSRGSSGGTNSAGFGGGAGLIGLLLPLLFSRRGGRFSWPLIIVAVVAYLVVAHVGSSGTSSSVLGRIGQSGQPTTADNTDLAKECHTGADANAHLECAVVADINSVQDYWGGGGYAALARHYAGAASTYTDVDTVFFRDQISTGCGAASASSGPFYCPADKLVYIDLSFYDQLKSQFGAEGGPLVNAYVLAHEYGHHVQDLLGTEAKVHSRQGASSDSVRLELQADCYAGVWMNHATQPADGSPALISDITQADIDSAVDTAQRIGDDYIETHLGNGTVDPDSFTHGTSAERKKWLTTGYRSGDATQCDTFATNDLG